MRGRAAHTAGTSDDAEAPGGTRTAQYVGSSLMEIAKRDGDRQCQCCVTNGIRVMRLVTGNTQTGDNWFGLRSPAQVNVACDIVRRASAARKDSVLAQYSATTGYHGAGADHAVAAPLWAFTQATGMAWENGGTTSAPLFQHPFYATGYPVAEASRAAVTVHGALRAVRAMTGQGLQPTTGGQS